MTDSQVSPEPASAEARARQESFTPEELRVVRGVTALFMLRMLGFYLVLPVLSTYAQSLPGSTPLLVGLSVGVYGLTQFLFQVPFGALSDRIGRRPVLTVGLALFAAGSIVCAAAHTCLALVVGRLVQGMGAIASVVVAMLADLTRDAVRTRAMVMVGVAIGSAFSIGLLFGPSAAERLGVPLIFWITAGLTVLAIGYLWWRIPAPPILAHHEDVEYSNEHLFNVLTNRHLLRLDLGVFNLHLALTSIFVTVPFLLREFIPLGHQWRLFLPLLSVGMAIMLGGAKLSERPGRGRKVAVGGQALLVGALILLALTVPASVLEPQSGFTMLVISLTLFIGGFALLEPLFPALLTRLCQQTNRGTAAGVYNMSQFSGAFAGGVVSGIFLDRDVEALFWILVATSTLSLLANLRIEDPEHLATLALTLPGISVEQRRKLVRHLLTIRGVEDVAWERKQERLLVRYASVHIDPERLRSEALSGA